MTHILVDTVRAYMGWCPHARPSAIAVPRTGVLPLARDLPDRPRSGTAPLGTTVPRWMTAVSIAILIATCFVGGNLWWPIIVLAILVIFVFLHIRTIQTQRRT